jgi:hypothetical protein
VLKGSPNQLMLRNQLSRMRTVRTTRYTYGGRTRGTQRGTQRQPQPPTGLFMPGPRLLMGGPLLPKPLALLLHPPKLLAGSASEPCCRAAHVHSLGEAKVDLAAGAAGEGRRRQGQHSGHAARLAPQLLAKRRLRRVGDAWPPIFVVKY